MFTSLSVVHQFFPATSSSSSSSSGEDAAAVISLCSDDDDEYDEEMCTVVHHSSSSSSSHGCTDYDYDDDIDWLVDVSFAKKPTKSVRFESIVHVHEIEPIASEFKSDVYLSALEMSDIRQQLIQDAREIYLDAPQYVHLLYTIVEPALECKSTTTASANTTWATSTSARGLERLLCEHLVQCSRYVLYTVLQHQHENEEEVAKKYAEMSAGHKQLAYTLAQGDAAAVADL